MTPEEPGSASNTMKKLRDEIEANARVTRERMRRESPESAVFADDDYAWDARIKWMLIRAAYTRSTNGQVRS